MALWVMFLKSIFLRENFAKKKRQKKKISSSAITLPVPAALVCLALLCFKMPRHENKCFNSPGCCLQLFIPFGLWIPCVLAHLSAQKWAATLGATLECLLRALRHVHKPPNFSVHRLTRDNGNQRDTGLRGGALHLCPLNSHFKVIFFWGFLNFQNHHPESSCQYHK